MKNILLINFMIAFFLLNLNSCVAPKEETSAAEDKLEVTNDAMENAVIYEANIRQYSEAGNFAEFTKDIPQLKNLGVKVIWLMPIHPISMTKRKAKGDLNVADIEDPEERKKYLGSYYSVSDYKGINPEFGTNEDFRSLVETAHENGMYVILDWVPNHTGWDHAWIKDHPEYYTKNAAGEITDPVDPRTGASWGWTDVADLNYENKELWEAMSNDMKYWVTEFDIDGFRCDVAGEVPTPFWEFATAEIQKDKKLFMLAESESRSLFHKAFDMGYNWEGHHIMNEIAKEKQTVKDWDEFMLRVDSTYQKDDYLMNFVTNHDENSWNGTVEERMGPAGEAMLAFSYMIPGMPLIYSGQEYDLNHRLLFFEKDIIPHAKAKNWPILEKLGKLKNENPALNGAKQAADYTRLEHKGAEEIIAFRRSKNDKSIYFIVNMSSEVKDIKMPIKGVYKNYMTGENETYALDETLTLTPWEYKILIP